MRVRRGFVAVGVGVAITAASAQFCVAAVADTAQPRAIVCRGIVLRPAKVYDTHHLKVVVKTVHTHDRVTSYLPCHSYVLSDSHVRMVPLNVDGARHGQGVIARDAIHEYR